MCPSTLSPPACLSNPSTFILRSLHSLCFSVDYHL
uniref:Uncharacterized protein n=1 Tax=Anguilla anguilla TaxID=7936 RepID=A0A0E9V2T8_ANGAN